VPRRAGLSLELSPSLAERWTPLPEEAGAAPPQLGVEQQTCREHRLHRSNSMGCCSVLTARSAAAQTTLQGERHGK